jgi:hypothetical protein
MRGAVNVESPNNITNWRMRFNSAFKGLRTGYRANEIKLVNTEGCSVLLLTALAEVK